MKLFLVTLQGLNNSTGVSYNSCYVLAEEPTQAYFKVRTWLDKKDFGFRHERELDSVKLIADDCEYCDIRVPLFP